TRKLAHQENRDLRTIVEGRSFGAVRGRARRCSLSGRSYDRASINRIRYFTAAVQPRPNKPNQGLHQQMYLRALRTIPCLTIHEGTFRTDPVWMPLVNPAPGGPVTVQVLKTEEKGSDVNIATFLVSDAYERDFDVALLISNDSDLCVPISLVRNRLGLKVLVYNPHKRHSAQLRQVAQTCATSAWGHSWEVNSPLR
ncbi:MAG: NYN domain-containing protein, partial [Chloroflexi bacterium]|nr:NYN domain-containing protein [Chloroflexota bacterium]